jgi:voltage-gated potassium channel
MSPRRLTDLSPRERQRAIAVTVAQCVLIVAAVIGLYYVAPLNGRLGGGAGVLRLTIGAIIFVGLMGLEVRRIVNADLPELRAMEALSLAFPIFIVLFASSYVSMSHAHPDFFTQPLNKTGGLYFAIVTLGTVGYGDIAPTADVSRIVVSAQILVDLAFLAIVVRILLGTAQKTLGRGQTPADSTPTEMEEPRP